MQPQPAAGHLECVQLSQLPPLTTLLVWTSNSFYRFVVMKQSSVWIQGGQHFADPALAEVAGASVGRGLVVDDVICIGLKIELRAAGTRIVTSPVVAMTTEPAGDSIH